MCNFKVEMTRIIKNSSIAWVKKQSIVRFTVVYYMLTNAYYSIWHRLYWDKHKSYWFAHLTYIVAAAFGKINFYFSVCQTLLLQMLKVTTTGSIHAGSQALGEVYYCLVDMLFLLRLFPDGLQSDFQLINLFHFSTMVSQMSSQVKSEFNTYVNRTRLQK